MVDRTRELELSLGSEEKKVMDNEKKALLFKEDLYIQRNLSKQDLK